MDDTNQVTQPTADSSFISSSLERGAFGEEDHAAMTIEFLRARLISERSVSKTARERAKQLAKKLAELEERLQVEMVLRKKLEADRLDILMKCRADLGNDYGDLFPPSLGEGFSRDESSLDSPCSKEHNADEEMLSCTPDQSGKGLPSSRLSLLDRSNSSPQLSCVEPNDEDGHNNQSGQEKGVLFWGRKKVLRREFSYGADWIGRSFSPRSQRSSDGESPHKKWAGKSVRQIRKKGSRPSNTNECGNEENQSLEECNSKIAQQNAIGDTFSDDERDTEVERVLEQQAELIEQYKDEENAQRAWEAKFTEGKLLPNFEMGMVVKPSDFGDKVDAMATAQSEEQELRAKKPVQALAPETTLTDRASDCVTKHLSEVHPEDTWKGYEGSLQSHSVTSNTSLDISEPSAVAFENNASDQVCGSIPNLEPPCTEKRAECSENCELEDPSHGQFASSSKDVEPNVDLVEPEVEAAQKSKLKRHLSSSFRFSALPNGQPVSETSPLMHGFTMYRQNDRRTKDISKDLSESNGVKDVSAFAGSHNRDDHDHAISIASGHNHIIAIDTFLMVDGATRSEDIESQLKEKDMLHESILDTGRQGSQLPTENDGAASYLYVSTSNVLSKDEESRKLTGLESKQKLPDLGRRSFELLSHMEARGPGSKEYLKQHKHSNLSHVDYGFQSSKGLDGARLENNDLFPDISMNPGSRVQGLGSLSFEERPFGSHRRSLDGFDKVADVLRVLEIAKLQVQSSNEQDLPSSSGRSDYDKKDAFYAEPAKFSFTYANPPQPYGASGALSSQRPANYLHNLSGWGALSSGHGIGLSRQVTNGPYPHYLSRMPDTPSVWCTPSLGIYNPDMSMYNLRQHREL